MAEAINVGEWWWPNKKYSLYYMEQRCLEIRDFYYALNECDILELGMSQFLCAFLFQAWYDFGIKVTDSAILSRVTPF